MKKLFALVCATLVSGCGAPAFISQEAKLAPAIAVAPSSIAAGGAATVKVTDERPDRIIGKRGLNGIGGTISAPATMTDIVRSALEDGLRKKGFAVNADAGPESAKLAIEIRQLQYAFKSGFWVNTVEIHAVLKAIASKNGKTYDHLYKGEKIETMSMGVNLAETNDAWINIALSSALQQMLQDEELIGTLAK